MAFYKGMALGDPVGLIDDGAGLNSNLFSILLVGDGYQASEAYLFWVHCWQVWDLLTRSWNFPDRKLSLFARPYSSFSRGTNIPHGCPHLSPAMATTYFDSGFLDSCRLLAGNNTKVNGQSLKSFQKALPGAEPGSAFTATVVLVNTPHRGASYWVETETDVIWVSAGHPEFLDLLQHELGHSMLLGDEYDYYLSCDDTYRNGTGVPGVVNVSNGPSPVPWAGTPGYSPRIVRNRGPRECATCDTTAASLLPAGIGAFEGAGNYHCGYFRPTRNCKMRDTREPFCPVCVDQIKSTIT